MWYSVKKKTKKITVAILYITMFTHSININGALIFHSKVREVIEWKKKKCGIFFCQTWIILSWANIYIEKHTKKATDSESVIISYNVFVDPNYDYHWIDETKCFFHACCLFWTQTPDVDKKIISKSILTKSNRQKWRQAHNWFRPHFISRLAVTRPITNLMKHDRFRNKFVH